MTQATQTRRPLPQVGEIFELTSSEELTGPGLVESFGWEPRSLHTSARAIPVGTTRRFRLVSVGDRNSLHEVSAVLWDGGDKVPNGCWIQVFNKTFSHNGHNPVGVADPSWFLPYSTTCYFPLVYAGGVPNFYFADNYLGEDWLWLAEVKDQQNK